MAFTVITLPSVASGEPVTTDFGVNVVNNLNDHESRIGVLELASNTNEYDAIVSSPAVAGFSTHTTISAAIGAVTAGSRILVLRGTYTENLSINKNLVIEGCGRGSLISGNIAFTAAAQNCIIEKLKFTGTLTFANGSTGNEVVQCKVPNAWSDTESNFVDNNNGVTNYIEIMEE